VNAMLNEKAPIYDALVAEMGDPVPAGPMDYSYEAALAQAGGAPVEPVSLPAKRSAPKSFAPKQMAAG
jgi:hypothetical protein